MNCEPINLSTIPTCPRCHVEHLDHEDEQDAGLCWTCQAEEAGFEMPEPQTTTQIVYAELDALCGVTHRRRTA